MADPQIALHAECDFDNPIPSIRSFRLGEKTFDVAELMDRWIGRDHWYFKVRVSDSDVYILRYSCETGTWEISLYCRESFLTGQYEGLKTQGQYRSNSGRVPEPVKS